MTSMNDEAATATAVQTHDVSAGGGPADAETLPKPKAIAPPPALPGIIHSADDPAVTNGDAAMSPVSVVPASQMPLPVATDSPIASIPPTPTSDAVTPGNVAPSSPSSPSSQSFSQSLRRIFSPNSAQKTAPLTRTGDTDGEALTGARKVFARLCACIVKPKVQPPAEDPNSALADLRAQLAELEPTYVPSAPLLPAPSDEDASKPCLVLDLDETLVHSSFTPISSADFEIPLDMQGEPHTVYVKKRPGVDNFLAVAAKSYEVVVFTASLALYANPVMDLLDPQGLVHARLYREHCVLIGGCYVKDIAKLGRPLSRTLIIDNSPVSYALQPENAVPIDAFYTDETDRELDDILFILEKARTLDDVRHFNL